MIGEKDLPIDGECSRTKTSKPLFSHLNTNSNQADKFSLRSSNHDGYPSKSSPRSGNELTLSYLCENREKFPDQKGKEVVNFSENPTHDEERIERDFFNNLRETKRKSAHHEYDVVKEEEEEEKKSDNNNKIENTLNLSLALPDVSLSLTASNAVKRPRVATNSERTASFSNDFTASYSHSHNPFSHNMSCSMTRNSTDFETSDHIWCAGEGTNGSVHSRFRPVGDGGVLAVNPFSGKPATSSEYSFFPSELPARPGTELAAKLPNPEEDDAIRSERVLYDIVSKSISSVALIIQGMAEETLEAAKEYLRNLLDDDSPRHKEKLTNLQSQIDKRSDLCKETLSKCVKDQLDILVAVRTGLKYFLSGKIRIPMNELVEIFLFLRCRNVNCKNSLPVDDCDCKICSNNKGFCSSCMCPVCLRFDSASNTCSWVGCDACSHWCHAACGIREGLIKPGYSVKGPRGRTEMLFHCIGCAHKSEMFGFVKDVFVCCAKNWEPETLVKELDCVGKVFRGSDDGKGKALHFKANEMVKKLESKQISPQEASNIIIQFFNHAESITEFPEPREQTVVAESSYRKDEGSVTPSTSKESQMKKSFALADAMMNSFDSLESMVRIKEAETRMFQKKADDARKEAESFKRMVEMKTEKMEEEYTEKIARLCLKETEERRRNKLEELKKLENSHCDYRNMKLRMESEIAGLLKRMESTRQQLV